MSAGWVAKNTESQSPASRHVENGRHFCNTPLPYVGCDDGCLYAFRGKS